MFRALIVDDARAELEVLLFLIQKNNLPLKTVTAINGEEALDRLRQEEFARAIRVSRQTGRRSSTSWSRISGCLLWTA